MINIRRIAKPSLLVATLIPSLCILGLVPQKTQADSSNGKIAFQRVIYSDSDIFDIYSMDADGAGLVNLTNSINSDRYSHPVVSPDGSRIAFVSNKDIDGNEIYVMNSDGSNVVRLTDNDVDNSAPSWSPDGSQIAFATYRSGSYEIYTMNTDGSDAINISNSPSVDFEPSWSPDGNKIAFISFRDDVNYRLYVMNIDGSGVMRLTTDLYAPDSDPAWSPDGSRIAFETSQTDTEINLINADGSGQVNITNNPSGDYDPAWSPDGNQIAFTTNRGGSVYDIYTMSANGSGQVNITDTSDVDESQPSWYVTSSSSADSDSDGISDEEEAAGPNSGDANGDGIADATQANVTTLVSTVTGEYVTVVSSCDANSGVSVVAESNSFKDAAFNYPAGLVGFTLTCSQGETATVAIYYFDTKLPEGAVARKYNSLNHSYQALAGTELSQINIAGSMVTKLQYSITDGGILDQDNTVNGSIVDPVGLAQSAVGVPNTRWGGGWLR